MVKNTPYLVKLKQKLNSEIVLRDRTSENATNNLQTNQSFPSSLKSQRAHCADRKAYASPPSCRSSKKLNKTFKTSRWSPLPTARYDLGLNAVN